MEFKDLASAKKGRHLTNYKIVAEYCTKLYATDCDEVSFEVYLDKRVGFVIFVLFEGELSFTHFSLKGYQDKIDLVPDWINSLVGDIAHFVLRVSGVVVDLPNFSSNVVMVLAQKVIRSSSSVSRGDELESSFSSFLGNSLES